jgi:hypothetical protein
VPAVAVLAACAAPSSAAAPSSDPTPSAVGWQEPADYSFTVTASCGERMFTGDYRVEVAGGDVVASQRHDATDGEWKPVDYLQWVPTLGDMLEEVARATDAPEAGEIVLETDPADGHPTEVRVDPLANAIDDETCYEITAYEPA